MPTNKTKVKLEFTKEQYDKFDNAIEHAYIRGFQEEKKYQAPKMIGDTLITYVVMRSGAADVLVMMKLQGANCEVSLNRPGSFGIEQIPVKEFLELPKVE